MTTHTRFIKWYIAGVLLPFGLLMGCGGMKTYSNTSPKNLHIRTETASSSFLSSVRAAVSIYSVDARCQLDYRGTVPVDEPSTDVGIPSGGPSYLVFDFASSSFLANSNSTISYETLLSPAAGHRYDITVSYRDDIYNVEIREAGAGESALRDVERKDLSACRSV